MLEFNLTVILLEKLLNMTAYQIGYLCGILITPFVYILVIGTIYYLIKKRRIPFRQAVFNRPVIASSLILFLVSLGSSANSSLQQESSHVYPDIAVKSFTANCVDSAKAKINSVVAEKICSCSIRELEKVYTYSEFKQLDAKIQKGAVSTPSKFVEIITACAQKQS